ncbi:thyroid transcription factor 1-associated protein 26 [Bufo gargarizans]|uniref:thyroid transcription factor 1-associated protein 26 n=1 Tax=Bufo gargarizans TaxID=30331 RepID=UPI001CF57C1E|nr:thyroid transcription factor 1-associated protein 26 [Bufo gargarizans]
MASTSSASSVSLQHRKRGRNEQGAIGGRGPGGKPKRKWRPNQDRKVFEGSTREGQGFALWRKKKVQSEYKKLLRKQKANPKEVSYSDHYPEHLRHLYVAEEERLKRQEKQRKPATKPPETIAEEQEVSSEHLRHLYVAEEETLKRQEKPKKPETKPPETIEEEQKVIPKKPFKKKTSNQKAKEEYERVQRERAKKREEAENNRKKREEAIKLHKQKRMEAYKVLSSKTKKGQPNFNVHMEYLLKKIQSKS